MSFPKPALMTSPVASCSLLVVRPGAPVASLLLVAMPGPPSSSLLLDTLFKFSFKLHDLYRILHARESNCPGCGQKHLFYFVFSLGQPNELRLFRLRTWHARSHQARRSTGWTVVVFQVPHSPQDGREVLFHLCFGRFEVFGLGGP